MSYAGEFLPALLDIGDSLTDGAESFLGAFTHAVQVALWYVRQEPEPAKRGQLFLDAMHASSGLSVMSRVLRGEDERHSKADSSLTVFTSEQLHEAKERWIRKFIAKGNVDRIGLARMHSFFSMLYGWREWKGDAITREWVDELVRSDEGLVAFLASAAGIVVTTSMGDHVSTQRTVTRLQHIEDFCSVAEIEDRVNGLSRSQLAESDRLAVESFERALKRRAAGKGDDGFVDDDE